MPGTKNLGQVAGLFIGTSAPSNTTLIWYDSTPAIRCHKVYSETLSQWIVLDSSVISAITYSELSTIAQTTGLTIGQWFKITDKSNVIALAITTTKIQYTDTLNNITIDDLGHSISYIVSSSNLLIDNIAGVYDTVNNKLLFSFADGKDTVNPISPQNNDNFYVLCKAKINNVWKFVKFTIPQFIAPASSGNSITWSNGIFLNFLSNLSSFYDTVGGVVSKAAYDAKIAILEQNILNATNNIQSVASQATAAVAAATTAAQVYSKQLPVAPTNATPVDIVQYDTLQNIVIKVHRWIQKFKYAPGISMSAGYAEPTTYSPVSNTDNVESAIAKLAKAVRTLRAQQAAGTDEVILASGYTDNTHHTLVPGTTDLTDVLEELAFRISRNVQPIYGIIAWHNTPTYDNIWSNAGYGWFPCGVFFYGNVADRNAEIQKWNDKYGSGNISITNTNVGSGYGYLTFAAVRINGTLRSIPNLSNRFIQGYDGANTSINIGNTGGSNTHTISAQELPAHSHNVNWASGGDGGHNHGGSAGSVNAITNVWGNTGKSNDSAGVTGPEPIYSIGYNSSSLTPTIGSTGSNHTHSITVDGGAGGTATGGTQSQIDTRPAYSVEAYLIRML